MKERCSIPRALLSACAIATMGLLLVPAVAKAGPIVPGKELDFRGGKGGTFSYTIGVGSTASVNNAPVNSVIGFPSFDSLSIDGGLLDLTTGQCYATCGEGIAHGFAYSVPQFKAGGDLRLYGGIPSLGIADGTLLFSGVFAPFTDKTGHTHPAVGMSLSANPNVSSGINAYLDVESLDPALLSYFNFNPKFTGGQGQLAQLLLTLTFVPTSWNGEIESSDLLVDPALPEPPSLLLFGTALLFVAYLVRRKVAAEQS